MSGQLSLELGKQLRDEGMRVASEHAESESPGWVDRALGYVKEYSCYHTVFMGEDVRHFAEGRKFEKPPHKRAWGAVMVTAAKRGIIEKVGTRQVTNAKAHRAIATLWRRV